MLRIRAIRRGANRFLAGDACRTVNKAVRMKPGIYFSENYLIMRSILFSCFLLVLGMAGSAQQFTQLSDSPLVTTPGDSRSVNIVDVNGDGLDDVFISNGLNTGQNNELYLNLGNGVFQPVQNDPIVLDNSPSDGATFADTDNDGDLDAYMVTWYGAPNFFYRNEGNGAFTHLTEAVAGNLGTYSETAAFGDFNSDGLVDVFVTNSGGDDLRNFLYRNTGNNEFVKMSGYYLNEQIASRSANWVDYDNDGHLDLYVTHEGESKNMLLRNNGNGGFIKITDDPTVAEMPSSITASWGDVNNDGWFDLFVGNTGNFTPENNRLFLNNGNGAFTAAAPGPINSDGGCTFGSAFADYDNDGDLDLFVANGFCNGVITNFLYKNTGAGVFERDLTSLPNYVTPCSYGAAWGDLDENGFPDLVIANCKKSSGATQPNHTVFMNNGNGNHWLKIKLVGTTSNRAAIGAQIRVKAVIDGQTVTQLRDISAQSGYCGQNSLTAQIGLGTATQADSIFIRWPSGQEQALGQTAAGQTITVVEGEASAVETLPKNKSLSLKIAPNPFGDSLNWTLQMDKPIRYGRFELTDTQGKTVLRKSLAPMEPGMHQFQAVTGHLPAGVYSLRLVSDIGVSDGVKVVK